MAKQCDGATCENCTKWNIDVIYRNRNDFHYCTKLEKFRYKSFYCSDHESDRELDQRLDDNHFDDEYS